jgi:hypothetical protein
VDVRTLTVGQIVAALDEYDIPDSWVLAKTLRQSDPAQIGPPAEARLKYMSDAFRNLVVGNIAEGVFAAKHLEPLKAFGYTVVPHFEKGDNRDFGVERDGLELPINVKTASTLFRKALSTVGLEPEDCIPISAYKANSAAKRVPDLVYVDLVDFALRERADAYMDKLSDNAAILWDLLSWYGGTGAKKAQDVFMAEMFKAHRTPLEALITDDSRFRVISAQRVKAIVREIPERCPGLGIKGAGTGGFNAEVNVHVSVGGETKPWSAIAGTLENDGIQGVLDSIRKRETRDVSAPEL